MSSDGELFASTFANSKEINLWHNLIESVAWSGDDV